MTSVRRDILLVLQDMILDEWGKLRAKYPELRTSTQITGRDHLALTTQLLIGGLEMRINCWFTDYGMLESDADLAGGDRMCRIILDQQCQSFSVLDEDLLQKVCALWHAAGCDFATGKHQLPWQPEMDARDCTGDGHTGLS
jgi:hypothetical protein